MTHLVAAERAGSADPRAPARPASPPRARQLPPAPRTLPILPASSSVRISASRPRAPGRGALRGQPDAREKEPDAGGGAPDRAGAPGAPGRGGRERRLQRFVGAPRPSRIATVGVGYADGWPRALSNRGAACFDGTMLPLVGRVSMDLTTVRRDGSPGIGPGDWLELLGPHRSLADVAEEAGASPIRDAHAARPPLRQGVARVNAVAGLRRDGGALGARRLPQRRRTDAVRPRRRLAPGPPAVLRPDVRARAARDRLFQPAGGGADGDLHRHGAGAAILDRPLPLLRRERRADAGGALGHARTRPGAGRADGRGARRRRRWRPRSARCA